MFKTEDIERLTQSAKDFLNIVWPKLQSLGWLEGELVPVEATSTKQWAKELDMLSGIDAWLIKNQRGLVGIASRVQWRPLMDNTRYPYNTINIRWQVPSGIPTEYQKRLEAVESGGELIYPYWTCHAYLEAKNIGPLISVGLIPTTEFITALGQGLGYIQQNPKDLKEFKCIGFNLLNLSGFSIKAYPTDILSNNTTPTIRDILG